MRVCVVTSCAAAAEPRAPRHAIAAKKAFEADGVTVSQFSEAAGGQLVFHLHFHVIPRYEGVALRSAGVMGDSALLAAHAEKLKAAMG